MPSISPVNTLPTLHEKTDVENKSDCESRKSVRNSSRIDSPTFSEKLKAARKLISFYPGKAKLVRSDSDSSVGSTSSDGMSDRSSDQSEINGYSCRSAELESRSFFRDYSIILE